MTILYPLIASVMALYKEEKYSLRQDYKITHITTELE